MCDDDEESTHHVKYLIHVMEQRIRFFAAHMEPQVIEPDDETRTYIPSPITAIQPGVHRIVGGRVQTATNRTRGMIDRSRFVAQRTWHVNPTFPRVVLKTIQKAPRR